MSESRDESTGQFASTEPLTGRAAELAANGWSEMPDPMKQDDEQETIGSDIASLREAGKKLARSNETIVRFYVDGEGNPIQNEAITIERAARDLNDVHAAESQSAEKDRLDKIAAAVDADRLAALSANANAAEVYGIDIPTIEKQQAENTDKSEVADKPAVKTDKTNEPPSVDGLAPEVEAALKHPQVRQAIEEKISAADKAREFHQSELSAATDVAKVLFFQTFPELAGVPQEHLAVALNQIAQQNPERAAQINSFYSNVSVLQQHQQKLQQQQSERTRQEFQTLAKAEDDAFDKMVANEPVAVRREAANEILAAAEECGIDRKQFMHLYQTQPIMRSAIFQKMMHDAARYRLITKAVPKAIAKPVPQVQRPGVSRPATPGDSEEVRAAAARFDKTPSVKNAAALHAAKQRANAR